MRIAVYLNQRCEPCDFFEQGQIHVFEGQDSDWEVKEKFSLGITHDLSLTEMKHAFAQVFDRIKNCKDFIVHEKRGIFRVFLEDMGFRIWDATDEQVGAQLNEVFCLDTCTPEECGPVLYPQQVGNVEDGIYRVNLVELLNQGVPLVSREILIPFLETTSFKRLEVLCDHEPRWLAFELPQFSMKIESTEKLADSGDLKLVIVPVQGGRTCPKGRTRRSCACSCGG